MTILNPILVHDTVVLDLPIWRLSVERYHALIASGALTEDDNLELLEGYLVEKMTINPPHAVITAILFRLFVTLCKDAYFVGSQQPVTMSDSETEPDILVVRGQAHQFFSRHPLASEVPLLIEVADSSLQNDQLQKKRIYARAGIPMYWIVNIPERLVEVYSQPSGNTFTPMYRQLQTYGYSDTVPVIVDGNELGFVAVSDLFPQESD